MKRYLYEQHQVPLHKINVISYGEEKPIAPNKTQGRPRAEPPRRHQGPHLVKCTPPRGSARICDADPRARRGGPGAERWRYRRNGPAARPRLNVSTFAGCFAFRFRSTIRIPHPSSSLRHPESLILESSDPGSRRHRIPTRVPPYSLSRH